MKFDKLKNIKRFYPKSFAFPYIIPPATTKKIKNKTKQVQVTQAAQKRIINRYKYLVILINIYFINCKLNYPKISDTKIAPTNAGQQAYISYKCYSKISAVSM
jgi:hypothetical protein